MSGFVARVHARPRPDLLDRLTAALVFRAPDGIATWRGEGVGLGHALFRTGTRGEPSSAGVLHDPDAGLHLVGDVRLDDRNGLVAALRAAGARTPEGVPGAGDADPALVLAAWCAWGTDAPERLAGDYAFVVWDDRRRTLFAARDPFGVKPLFVAETREGGHVVSNTLAAILAHPDVEGRPDERSLADHVLVGWVHDERRTDFEDVRQVERGSWWAVGPEGVRERRWWRLPDPPPRERPRADVLDEFDELVHQAVADRLPEAPHPAVLQLSGGLDSGTIACASVDVRGGPAGLPAVTVGYGRLFDDPEPPLARQVAAALGLEHTVFEADDAVEPLPGMAAALPDWARIDPDAWHRGPGFDLADVDTPPLAARGRVTLTGWDGDAVLYGDALGALSRLLRRGRVWGLARALASWADESRRRGRLAKVGLRGALARRREDPDPMEGYPDGLFDPDFEARLGLRDVWRDLSVTGGGEAGHPRRAARATLESPVWSALFHAQDPGYTGVLVEARHPLLDRRLVEFFLGLPPIPWCVEKGLFRGWLEGRLPPSVVRRPKQGLQGDPVALTLAPRMATPLGRETLVRRLDPGPQDPLVGRRVCRDGWRDRVLADLDPDGPDGMQPWWATRVHAASRWLRRLDERDAPDPDEGGRGDGDRGGDEGPETLRGP